MKNIFISSLILLGITFSANAQTSTSAASANLIAAMTITNTQVLHFGDLTIPTTASVVVMSTAGSRSVSSGDVVLISSDVGTEATFNMTGLAASTYDITLPSSDVTITNGVQTMLVNTFLFLTTDASDAANPVTVPAAGSDSFAVGATLNMGTDEIAGSYTGDYDVTLAYN
ncbi:MAG: DUF4402 domain-containing protein [Flavobacteriaceae bacterium]|nr:DUF4402 domain-containing protein [Flavobacteriaceae bacterium]